MKKLCKILKLGSKIHQVGVQNRLKSKPKSSLEGSWGHLGPKRPQEAPREKKRVRKGRAFAPPAAPSWAPKSIKIGPKSDQKYNHFFDGFEDRFLQRFGANLAPSWPPKASQNGAKLAPKSMQVGVLIWMLFLKGSWHHF